ncbi:MAG: DUF3996 domain-containing protein [Proteobacteria bacterium]|nr:DUF3996 domain-containing protein [Pseudomonadota bacterium]
MEKIKSNRKSLIILFLALILPILPASLNPAQAQDRGVGLGVILGEPTGVVLKGWITKRQAVDGGLAWSFGRRDSLHVHADYLFHEFNLFKVEEGQLPMYFGVGGRFKLGDNEDDSGGNDDRVGVRIPVGIDYLFRKVPVDIFLEIVPIMDLVPETAFALNAGIGARFFFEPAK